MLIFKELGLGASYRDAHDYAQVFFESFRKDIALWGGRPKQFQFRDDSSINSPTAARAVDVLAWHCLEAISMPGARTWIAYSEGGDPLAVATWNTPKYSIHQSMLQRIQWLWTRIKVKVAVFYHKLRGVDFPFFSPAIMAGIHDIESQCGYSHSSERIKELLSLPEDQLGGYTEETAQHLALFGTSERAQGQGVGSKLFEHAFSSLRPEPVVITDGKKSRVLPPRFSIMATDAGQRLYTKFDFKPIDSGSVQVDSGTFNLALLIRSQ